MAILGFHFSGVYKKSLLSGKKTATIMNGRHYFKKGEFVQVYLSNKPNLFEGRIEKRIGEAKIERVITCKVKDLTSPQALACGHKSLSDLKKALKKWYNANDNSLVTFVKFKLKLF
jgi:hypothetical protein